VGAFSFELPSFANAVIMVYLVLACVIRQHHYLRAALDNSAVRYLGTISYGMYLLNMLALNLVRKILGDSEGSLQQFACTTIVVILIASISYYGFEAPFLRLKKRFSH
jgi:peptidoglycan/LPS O-acetylase OafA/YrhL